MKGSVAPRQGFVVSARRVPRALPWAGLLRPLRGEESVFRRSPPQDGPESVGRLLQVRRARKPNEPKVHVWRANEPRKNTLSCSSHTNPTRQRGAQSVAAGICPDYLLADASGWYQLPAPSRSGCHGLDLLNLFFRGS